MRHPYDNNLPFNLPQVHNQTTLQHLLRNKQHTECFTCDKLKDICSIYIYVWIITTSKLIFFSLHNNILTARCFSRCQNDKSSSWSQQLITSAHIYLSNLPIVFCNDNNACKSAYTTNEILWRQATQTYTDWKPIFHKRPQSNVIAKKQKVQLYTPYCILSLNENTLYFVFLIFSLRLCVFQPTGQINVFVNWLTENTLKNQTERNLCILFWLIWIPSSNISFQHYASAYALPDYYSIQCQLYIAWESSDHYIKPRNFKTAYISSNAC